MWLTIMFGLVNGVLSFVGNYFMRLSALELSPFAIAVIAQRGGNVVLSSIILVLAYDIVSPKDLRYIWFKLPLTIAIGFLALKISSFFLLILIYHLGILLLSIPLGFFNPRYGAFAVINFAVNFVAARLWGIFF